MPRIIHTIRRRHRRLASPHETIHVVLTWADIMPDLDPGWAAGRSDHGIDGDGAR